MENVARQECEEGTFRRGELSGRFIARKLFGQSDKRYDKEYWGRLKRNWRQQKEKRSEEMETIAEEEEIGKESLGVKEQTEKNGDEMGNMMDPYYEL